MFRGTMYQNGYGRSKAFQKGMGIGGLFNKFFNFISPIIKKATPLIKSGAKELGKNALKTIGSMAFDVASGKNVSDVAKETFINKKEELKTVAKDLGQKALKSVANVANQVADGTNVQESILNQMGTGIKRKKRFKKYIILKKQTKHKDIFD